VTMESLRVKKVRLTETGTDFHELTKGFVSIRTRNLFPGSVVPCDLYFPFLHGGQALSLEKALASGDEYTAEFHDKLISHGIQTVYIRKEAEASFSDYFTSKLQQIINSPNTPSEVKTQLIYDDAESIVKKVLRERPDQGNIRLGRRFVNYFAIQLAADEVTADALLVIFSKDYYTFTHMVQVALLGMAFCRFLGWKEDDLKSFGFGALFHDVGKSSIDNAILNKPGKLDADEFDLMKAHPRLGYERVKKTHVMTPDQLSVILHHHEALDGSGYPDGLEGNDISLYARIARIADCFDALTTNRPYKSALPPAKAIKIMTDEMGHTFDRELLARFVQFLGLEEADQPASGLRLQIDLGIKVLLELEKQPEKWNGLLVGMEPERYLIVRVPALAAAKNHLQPGSHTVCRYICRGNVVQFRTKVLGHVLHPVKLLFLKFPSGFQVLNLRKNPRIECFLPADVDIEGRHYPGTLLDISIGGCKFSSRGVSSDISSQLPVGASITLFSTLFSEPSPLPFAGLVRHVEVDRDKFILGIQFERLDGVSHQKLSAFLENMLVLVR